MMRKIQISFLAFAAFFSTGCPKYRPSVNFNDKGSFVNKVNDHFADMESKYFAALPRDPATAKIIRNELIEDSLPYIDGAYIDFITDIQRGRDRTNFVADVIELGTTAAVGITKGERPLQILGVALTAFRGGRRSADLNFYKEQSTPVLIIKMDGNRARVRATILTREKSSVEDYPMGAAISDIVDYYNAGTLVRAFTELQKDTALQTKASEDNVLMLKGVPITPEATLDTRDLAVSASDILQVDIFTQLNDPAEKALATKRLQNIVEALEKDKDAAAALKNAGASSKDTDGVKLRIALIAIRRAAALVNNAALLKTINRAIVDTPIPPMPAPSPTSSPTPSPATPTATPPTMS